MIFIYVILNLLNLVLIKLRKFFYSTIPNYQLISFVIIFLNKIEKLFKKTNFLENYLEIFLIETI